MERAKTEAGVFISRGGLGDIKSSVPEVTCKNNKRTDASGHKQLHLFLIFPHIF